MRATTRTRPEARRAIVRRTTAVRTSDRAPRAAGGGSPVDPRIRARRAAVLRAEARRRLHVALAALCIAAVVVAGWWALHSSLFAARVVTVVGSTHTPVGQIEAAAGLTNHPPLIDVGAAAVAGVERLPWVADATVTRQWPDGVRIVVRERTPVAAVKDAAASAGWALVDRTGRVLARQAGAPAGLPGVAVPRPAGSPGSETSGIRATLRVVSSLPKAFADQVASASQTRRGEVTLELTSPVTVYLGSTEQLSQKYEDVAAILKGAALASGSTIDVASPAAPFVKA
ncbi:MAG: cell division protein FtsQ/DivIB [Acidimicrobiales bacterium]